MEKILVKELKIGDRVVKLDASWLDTPFLKHNFVVKDQKTIDKLIKSGIDYVYIEKRKVDAQKSEEKNIC